MCRPRCWCNALGMFVVSEAEAAAIRTNFQQRDELSPDPLCRAEIGYYRRKDQAAALCFVGVSEAGAVTPEGITQQRAMERFLVRARDRRILSGAAARAAPMRIVCWLRELSNCPFG
jgi:hypothetical protein